MEFLPISDLEKDLLLAYLSEASLRLENGKEKGDLNFGLDERKEVIKTYEYLKKYMNPIVAGWLTLETSKIYQEKKGLKKFEKIAEMLCTEQGYIRGLLHDDSFFNPKHKI